MMSHTFKNFIPMMIVLGVFTTSIISGCAEQKIKQDETTIKTPPPDTTQPAATHDHPSEGPHHGDLIELGNEEYHAEIVHNESGEVTIYILDSSAKNAVQIEAKEILINTSHSGKAQQFKLSASSLAGEESGKSSVFTIVDQELAKLLDNSEVTAKLVLTIAGKQYSGKIEHDHNHDHSDHKH